MILSFQTYRSGQTVQTQIRLLLEEQSDQGIHCLLFHLHFFDEIPYGLASLFEFQGELQQSFLRLKIKELYGNRKICPKGLSLASYGSLGDIKR